MEIILAVLQPKQNVSSGIEYRPKLYNILLLDHRTYGEKSRPTKYLPTFPLTSSEEPRDEVLTNLLDLTGGEHGGIKGERAILVPWTKDSKRQSLARFALYCVPINVRDKLSRLFVEKSSSSPGLFSLDYVIETLNNGTVNYPPPTKVFISQLESWLKEKHSMSGAVDILFRSRAEYRLKFSISNPASLPNLQADTNVIVNNSMPQEVRQTANEAMAKMLSIEKCEIVVINPIFGSGLPYKTKVDSCVQNIYWGNGMPDYDSADTQSSRSSTSSLDRYKRPIHKLAREGNIVALRECIKRRYYLEERDAKKFTALHWAAWGGHADAAKLLIDYNAKPNVINNLGQTPLHIAANHGFPAVVEVLLRVPDINLEVYDSTQKTPLNYCELQMERSPPHKKVHDMLRSAINKTSELAIHIADGTMKLLKMATCTTVRQLNQQLLKEYKLPEMPYSEIFTIWICSGSLELQLKQDHRPVEHLSNWTKKIVGMLTDRDPKQEIPKLCWRRNAKIGLSEEKRLLHDQAVYLLFHEAYQNYIKALYPCKDNDVLTFASIYIFLEQKGEFDVGKAKAYLREHLKHLVPEPMLKAKGHNWPTRILDYYKKHCTNLRDELSVNRNQTTSKFLHLKFLECSRNLTVYGSAFFTGNLQTSQGPQGRVAYSQAVSCLIGVNDVGIHVIDSKTRVMLQSFKYTEINRKLPDSGCLDISVKRFEGKVDKNATRHIKIHTKQAGLIDHLMKKLSEMHALDDRNVDIVYIR